MNTSSNRRHLVIGAGPVGSGTALRLVDSGDDVRLVTRSGSGPRHPRIELVAADASSREQLTALAAGMTTIFNCANPPYHRWAVDWPPLAAGILAAAEATGARVVTMGNLYVYGLGSEPMRATDPLDPPSKKGAVRAAMWREALAAQRAGRVEVTEIRASDFFGPGLGGSAHLGERFVPRLIAGKSVSVLGRPDRLHSWTYIHDVTRTLATLGTDDRAFGRAWHVPTGAPQTVDAMASLICDAAGLTRPKVRSIPTVALRVAGVFSSMMRELPEMIYQFDRPFVMDASDTVATFGLDATPLDEQIATTVTAYRDGAGSTGSDELSAAA